MSGGERIFEEEMVSWLREGGDRIYVTMER